MKGFLLPFAVNLVIKPMMKSLLNLIHTKKRSILNCNLEIAIQKSVTKSLSLSIISPFIRGRVSGSSLDWTFVALFTRFFISLHLGHCYFIKTVIVFNMQLRFSYKKCYFSCSQFQNTKPSPSALKTELGSVEDTEFQTTSASVTPIKLQTISSFSGESSTMEVLGVDKTSTSASAGGKFDKSGDYLLPPTGKFTIKWLQYFKSEIYLHRLVPGNGWRDQMTSTHFHHADSLETEDPILDSNDKDKIEYEYKTGLGAGGDPLKNESGTREGLQGEGSNHQPVVFVGGPGYVPPNSLRQRPSLEAANPIYQTRPVAPAESRYPVHHQSPWDRNYRNPFNMTRVQRKPSSLQ